MPITQLLAFKVSCNW